MQLLLKEKELLCRIYLKNIILRKWSLKKGYGKALLQNTGVEI